MNDVLTPGSVRARALRFIDSLGFVWQASELPRVSSDAKPESGGWLYFFSRGMTVVLRDYPAHWAELPWGELERLRSSGVVLSADVTREVTRPRSGGAVAEMFA